MDITALCVYECILLSEIQHGAHRRRDYGLFHIFHPTVHHVLSLATPLLLGSTFLQSTVSQGECIHVRSII